MKFLKKIKFEIDNLNIKIADKLIDRREWKKYNPEHKDSLDIFETLDFVIKLEDEIIERKSRIRQYREYLILQKIKEETEKEFKRPFELVRENFKDIA